jgi:drug/metabolite transporter (DMT)-like permease
MTTTVFLVIALSGLFWSIFDTTRKRLAESVKPGPAVVWLMLLQTPLFVLFGVSDAWPIPASDYWLPSLGSLFVNLLANIWFIEAVALAPLSLAIPILSLTPVFSALGGYLFLGEPTTARQAAGIVVIVAATFGLARFGSRSDSDSEESKEQSRTVRKGLLLMGVVALLWASTPVLDKVCLRFAPASQHAFIQCLGIALFLGLWLKVRGLALGLPNMKRNLIWLAAAVLFAALALFTQFWSIQFVPVGIFEALKRSIGLIAALGLGALVFSERLTRLKVLIVMVMGLGIFLLLV